MLTVHTALEQFKISTTPFILALDLTKTRAGNSHGCCNYIVFEKPSFGNVFRPTENKNPGFSNSSSLKSRDKLVWTIDPAVETELRLYISSA